MGEVSPIVNLVVSLCVESGLLIRPAMTYDARFWLITRVDG